MKGPYKQDVLVWLQLAEALAHMHQYGLIHRDIKAENIVFKDTATQAAAKGVPPIVKFIDLGMAMLYNKDEHIQGTRPLLNAVLRGLLVTPAGCRAGSIAEPTTCKALKCGPG